MNVHALASRSIRVLFAEWLHSPFTKGDGGQVANRKRLQGGFATLAERLNKKQLAKNSETIYFQSVYYLPYNKDLKTFSRQLRNNSTHGEILLWKKLRAGSMMSYTFNRQKPIGRYIVDFYCKPLKLVIEIDGGYHEEEAQKIKDHERQQVLEEMELNFLRFPDKEVRKNIDGVLKAIENYILNYQQIL
jgi:very-short-patch-repair endonuclease